MSTPITDFLETLRFLTGDMGDVQRRSDAVLRMAVQSVIKLNKLPDAGYVLADAGTTIEPALTNPNHFALICFHAVRFFTMGSTEDDGVRAYSYKRRARSESWGSGLAVLMRWEDEIYALESSTAIRSWQTYLDYCEGKVGLPESLKMIDVERDAPWGTLSV